MTDIVEVVGKDVMKTEEYNYEDLSFYELHERLTRQNEFIVRLVGSLGGATPEQQEFSIREFRKFYNDK